jgi:hypothetical protein
MGNTKNQERHQGMISSGSVAQAQAIKSQRCYQVRQREVRQTHEREA